MIQHQLIHCCKVLHVREVVIWAVTRDVCWRTDALPMVTYHRQLQQHPVIDTHSSVWWKVQRMNRLNVKQH